MRCRCGPVAAACATAKRCYRPSYAGEQFIINLQIISPCRIPSTGRSNRKTTIPGADTTALVYRCSLLRKAPARAKHANHRTDRQIGGARYSERVGTGRESKNG